jgi:hypothetical protein
LVKTNCLGAPRDGKLVGMRVRIVLLLGLLSLAVPGVLMLLALRDAPRPERAWPTSPPEPPLPSPVPPPRWDHPARSSLALLRRTTANEARRSLTALGACEREGRRHYRRCATAPLARTNAFAAANSRMLSGLAGASGPTRACRGRVLQLSGTAGTLATVAKETLRGALQRPWPEVLDASRSVRGLAAETLRLARKPGWGTTCRPRPRVKTPAAPVL